VKPRSRTARNYPVTLELTEDDPRFTMGLTFEVSEVLKRNGYPQPEALDFIDLQQALFRFLYQKENR